MLARFRYRSPWLALAVAAGLVLAVTSGVAYWLLAGLPPLDDLHGYAAAPSSKVYDRYGRLLFEMPPPYSGLHSPIPLDEMPQALRDAIVSTEDASFYENPGVDGWAIVRALWINLRGGEVLSGGSTITQQLARNLLMSPEERYQRTLTRKSREAVLAWRIARRYSKDEILELYLNEIYFGNMAYGVEAAAQAYFGKQVRDLDLAECAMLAGLPQAPSYLNPLEDLPRAKARQAVVLGLMVKNGVLTAPEARRAGEEKLYFASAPLDIRAPHFVMYVRGLLERELGLERLEQGGLQIYTTLDLDLNETARDLVRHRLVRLAECNGVQTDCPPGGHNMRNAALVALDPQTGEILAMLGSPDYFSARIDGAVNGTTALRQPGSSIKPVTYAAALGLGELTPATLMLDVRTSFVTKEGASYVPLNYDLQFRGPVRLREALASSYNLIAVKVLDTIGVEAMTGLARRLGITTFDDPDRLGLAMTLGGGEVRLLELSAAYAAFANGGYAVRPVAILRVQDDDGNILLDSNLPSHLAAEDSLPSPHQPQAAGDSVLSSPHQPQGAGDSVLPSPHQPQGAGDSVLSSPLRPQGAGGIEGGQVLDPRTAYLISDILSDDLARIPSFGEGSALDLGRPAAVKTGTTTDFRDNWTVGYTPDLVVGVWAGNADNEPMRQISGASGAAPIWHDFMDSALKGQPVRDFERPDGLVEVEVCALSGLLPGRDCPHHVTELFLAGTEPVETCAMHQRIALDRATGLRATEETPLERIVEKVYTMLPPEAQAWAREQGIAEPPPFPEQADQRSEQQNSAGWPGDEPPLVMVNPDAGAAYALDSSLPHDAQQIAVSARPGAGATLAEVTLLVDGQPLVRLGAPPYEALWKLEPGLHVFSAQGLAAGGNQVVSDEVWVEVRE